MCLSASELQVIAKYVYDDAAILIFLLNNDGEVIWNNRYCQKLLGHNIAGQNFQELVVDFQNTFRLEEYTNRESGRSLLTLNIPNGLPRSFLFTFRRMERSILVFGENDADELEQLRSELLHVNQELNNLTRSLHKKNAELAHLHDVKNQFLGMAAHDLRKPISVILSYTEFLLDETKEVLNEEHTGFLNRIENSVFFMKRLVDDFLDVSAIESGHFKLNIVWVDPVEILERSLVLAKIQALQKGIGLDVTIETEQLQIPVDAEKIEQAMSNLLANAIEHSPIGTCVSVVVQETKEKILISVEDRGIGMSQEETKQLFMPFKKGVAPKTGREKSTGLGLAITRKIIDAHHGEIVVESEEGKGTKLTVYLNRKMP